MPEIQEMDGIVLEMRLHSKPARDTTVLVDMDDTIEDLLPTWVEYLNRSYGYNVDIKDIDNWNIRLYFPTLTREQIYEPFNYKEFWSNVTPRQDAIHYLKKLYNEGYRIYICTASDYRTIRNKYEFIIKRYFSFITWDKMIITYNKQMICADYLIDDGIHNLENGNFIKVLMTAPHNKSYDASANGMFRADNWKEIYDFIHKNGKKR